MKRVRLLLIAVLCAASQAVYAQNDLTAYNLSNTASQDGTARSVAMGNAMTALGGDLGSININPAGVAVYKFSEIGFTPSLTTISTQFDLYGSQRKSNRTNLGVANTGAVFYFPIGGRSALRNINFGFTYTNMANYSSSLTAKNNSNTSDPTFVDYITDYTNAACRSWGVPAGEVASKMDINNTQDPYRNFGGAMWPSILAWNSSLMNLNAAETAFIPTVQNEIIQKYKMKTYGYNGAADFSLGFNFNDIVYLGANVTINSVYNRVKETYTEEGVGAQDFRYMDLTYEQRTTGSGIGAKVGIILNPAPFLRLGAAVSTPTLYDLTDKARWDIETSLGSDYYVNLRTPRLEMDYEFTSPFKYNFGAALVFPVVALSLDYEGTDYSHMKFHSASHGPDEEYDWGDMNDLIKEYYKRQDKIRAGIEINPTPFFSLRGGFQYSNSGIKNVDIDTYVGSIGAGFSTAGGFFADLGFSANLKKTDFLYDAEDLIADYAVSCVRTDCKRFAWKALLTIGFRF